jgi:hypothetical protein
MESPRRLISAKERRQQTSNLWLLINSSGKRFVVRADEKLSAFVELERQVLTVTFYLESIQDDSCRDQ